MKRLGKRGENIRALALLLLFLLSVYASAAEAHGTVSIVDDAGNRVSLKAPARRIIPLYAALSENLVEMGLAERIVARTVSDDSLPDGLPVVGTHMRPNLEIITGLRPDLVVQLEGRAEAGLAAEALSRLGVPVARFRIASFAGLFSCIERLGVLCGEEEAAAGLINGMKERLRRAGKMNAAFAGRPKVFFEVRYPNLLGAGGGSMLTDIIAAAGGENCLAGYRDRMVRLSEEALAMMNPDIYLVQWGAMNKNPLPPEQRPHFRTLRAVMRDRVFFVPESRFSRPGPQSVKAVEELAQIIRAWHEGQP